MKNSNLYQAKKIKNDEFYTRLEDIENELKYYKEHFKDKVVYCNCDNEQSKFWVYFHLNFNNLGLKKLLSNHYCENGTSYVKEYTGEDDADCDVGTVTCLDENGDFRNAECVEILKKADIVVTNPPFSLFRTYIAQLIDNNKFFIVIGNMNAITYKKFFPLIKSSEISLGYTLPKKFILQDKTEQRFGNVVWFTNLETTKERKVLDLNKKYSPELYPLYDNYNAINVDKVKDIPVDYSGAMGVPISFLNKFNPEQFEILGFTGGVGRDDDNSVKTTIRYKDCKQHNPDGTVIKNDKINTGATLFYKEKPKSIYYTASNREGYLKATYGRIIIRKRID